MKDQVDALRTNGIAAAYINSSLSYEEHRQIQEQVKNNQLSILYIAPERFAIPSFQQWLKHLPIQLIAIDEAHCISEWGHDFRPDYRNLKVLRSEFPTVPVIALTATATKQVREDIINQLSLHDGKIFTSGFNRPNLSYIVEPKGETFSRLCYWLNRYKGEPTIIYAFSRKNTEELAADLNREGFNALAYHAGLDPETRRYTQEQFVRDKVSIIVATIAFGMGIDKPDVRLVIHADLPKSVEGYYQETGRAGRDGLPSDCVLFYSPGDIRKHRYFIQQIEDDAERQRASEKLSDIVTYCERGACRRTFLLEYFGDQYHADECGNCDACLTPKETFDATEIAQKIISAILKTGEKYGGSYIVEVLKGSRIKSVRERGHQDLSVFGIVGREYSKEDLKVLIRQIEQAGLILKQDGEYPTLYLTPQGREWLMRRDSLELVRPAKRNASTASEHAEPVDVDHTLFERLRDLRKQLADEAGVPPFVIFGNQSLMEMATYFPTDLDQFSKITGVGDQKLVQFGESFTSHIKTYCIETGKQAKPIPRRIKTSTERRTIKTDSTYQITKSLIEQGRTIGEVAKERRMAESTVMSHIEKLLRAGETVSLNHIEFRADRFQVIKQAFQRAGDSKLTPVKELLGDEYSYDELRLARLLIISHSSLAHR